MAQKRFKIKKPPTKLTNKGAVFSKHIGLRNINGSNKEEFLSKISALIEQTESRLRFGTEIISIFVENYGCSLEIKYVDPNDANFLKRKTEYEEELAKYNVWYKAHAKEVEEELALRELERAAQRQKKREVREAKIKKEIARLKKKLAQ